MAADLDALAWQTAVVGAGGTVSGTQLSYVSTLIAGLKADEAWAKLDRLWLYASESATQASIDLVARATHTLIGSPTFTANHGYAGDGSAAYIDTVYKPSVNAINYASNNACFGFNIRTAESRTAANYYFAATNNNTSACNGIRKNNGGAQYNFAVNCSGTAQFTHWNLGPRLGAFTLNALTLPT